MHLGVLRLFPCSPYHFLHLWTSWSPDEQCLYVCSFHKSKLSQRARRSQRKERKITTIPHETPPFWIYRCLTVGSDGLTFKLSLALVTRTRTLSCCRNTYITLGLPVVGKLMLFVFHFLYLHFLERMWQLGTLQCRGFTAWLSKNWSKEIYTKYLPR